MVRSDGWLQQPRPVPPHGAECIDGGRDGCRVQVPGTIAMRSVCVDRPYLSAGKRCVVPGGSGME